MKDNDLDFNKALASYLRGKENRDLTVWFWTNQKEIQFALALAKEIQAGDYETDIIKAMSESKASCDECDEYESLGDHLGYSGENKTRIVLRAAYKAMTQELMKKVKEDLTP